MKLKKFILLLLFIVTFLSGLNAQSAKQIIKKLSLNYSSQAYQFDFKVNMISSSTKSILASQSGSVAKDQGFLYSKSMNNITISNDKNAVLIDNEDRSIIVSNSTKNIEETNFDITSYLDSVISQNTYKLISSKNGVFKVNIELQEIPLYKNVTLVINESYELISCEYELSNSTQYDFDKIVIYYSNRKFGISIDKGIFSVKNILKIRKNKIIGVGKYSNYTIIDNRQKPN